MSTSRKVRVAVIGATGYAGAEVCALLSRHGGATIASRYAGSRGEQAAAPGAAALDIEALLAAAPDCAVLATPNEISAALAPRLVESGCRVIDLSGAFRLKDASDYPRWYGFPHPAPGLLDEAVYGLTERLGPARARLDGCRLVANPGCYATSALLALGPLVPLLDPAQPIICDAHSGVSGAGRRAELSYSFAEMSGNFKAYGAGGHRHEPEIRQEAGLPAGTAFVFVPHLLPVVRGILSTLHLAFRSPVTPEDIAAPYRRAYAGSRFVSVLPAGELPELKSVVGTPRCAIGFALRDDGARAVVVSAIDNLLKGAASQAVQNFNHMFGFDEEEGLR